MASLLRHCCETFGKAVAGPPVGGLSFGGFSAAEWPVLSLAQASIQNNSGLSKDLPPPCGGWRFRRMPVTHSYARGNFSCGFDAARLLRPSVDVRAFPRRLFDHLVGEREQVVWN